MLLVKQRLARLVSGWVTHGSCSGADVGLARFTTVGYENHKPYLRTPYLNRYQIFFCLVRKESKDSKLHYWWDIKTECIIKHLQ